MTQGVGCLFGEFESTRWTVKKELGPHQGHCFSAGARHPPQIGPRCPSRPLHGFRLTNLEKSERKKFARRGGLAERCRAVVLRSLIARAQCAEPASLRLTPGGQKRRVSAALSAFGGEDARDFGKIVGDADVRPFVLQLENSANFVRCAVAEFNDEYSLRSEQSSGLFA